MNHAEGDPVAVFVAGHLDRAEALLRESGFYRDPADTSRAGVVTVAAGGTRDSVDFIVDFDARHPISYWFPPQR